ncbi:DUF5685 family protein [Nocardia altamirensis]|uniref:DUF5685 family protein n=1 Tax=Nocardia altamirensis TaxID=472158 RepID=UPI000A4CD6AF|nr:DUF5685 family protein [Nocardia altamirensis]
MLRPCAHGAAKYGIDRAEWRAHLCGLCLGLRDGHGQLARATTNVDAIVLSMLTEAQLSGDVERTTAGRCALRGMQRASVATADSPGVQLATTASLLLASAKIRDHVADGDARALARTPMAKAASRWAGQAQDSAQRIGLDVESLVAALGAQTQLEAAALVGANQTRVSESLAASPLWREAMSNDAEPLAWTTAPTQLCASEFFAHTAVLAGRPDNVDAMRSAGWQFGRIAHLADAVQDFEQDQARGRFNPLAATGTSMPQAYDLLRESNARLRDAVAAAELDEVPTVRWMLLDPLRAVLGRLGRGIGAGIAHSCNVSRHTNEAGDAVVPQMLDLVTPQAHLPGNRRPTRRPGIGESLTLILGAYCTGYACCADHTRPCSGERKDAWIKRCDCSGCSDGGCGGCCDSCSCDCCGCDCSC